MGATVNSEALPYSKQRKQRFEARSVICMPECTYRLFVYVTLDAVDVVCMLPTVRVAVHWHVKLENLLQYIPARKRKPKVFCRM
eukprot:9240656-Pyramimonas_sp.AAC.1